MCWLITRSEVAQRDVSRGFAQALAFHRIRIAQPCPVGMGPEPGQQGGAVFRVAVDAGDAQLPDDDAGSLRFVESRRALVRWRRCRQVSLGRIQQLFELFAVPLRLPLLLRRGIRLGQYRASGHAQPKSDQGSAAGLA